MTAINQALVPSFIYQLAQNAQSNANLLESEKAFYA
jgi:hypothetical protein